MMMNVINLLLLLLLFLFLKGFEQKERNDVVIYERVRQ